MTISVILPVYGEVESLKHVVEGLAVLLEDKLQEIILVIHPLSSEGTFQAASQLKDKYPCLKICLQSSFPGLGLAFRQGLGLVTGSQILMMDSDGEMDVNTVPVMVDKMRQTNCDLVIASRWLPEGGAQGYNAFNYFFNRGFQMIFRGLFRTPLHDLTLGFKLFDGHKINRVVWNSRFHEIAVETTLRPIKSGWHIEEVPTRWVKRKAGVSRNPFWRSWRYVTKAVEILCS